MDQITGIDPLYAIGSQVNVNKVHTKKDAEKEFVAVFLQQVMKDVFKAQSSMMGDEGALGMFSDNLYNDIMISKVSRDLAENKAFGFDDAMMNKLPPSVISRMVK
jgi:Rod binding domain-containing protein